MESEYDDSLQMIHYFETVILPSARKATNKDLTKANVIKCVSWARSVNSVTKKLDPKQPSQVDRLIRAFFDNIHLKKDVLNKHLHLFFEDYRPKDLENARMGLNQREDIRKLILRQGAVRKDELLKTFLTSHIEIPSWYQGECDKSALISCMLFTALRSLRSDEDKIQLILHTLDNSSLEDPVDQSRVLQRISEDLVDGNNLLQQVLRKLICHN